MNILVTGSTGFIGSALVSHLLRGGHSVTRLVRRSVPPSESHVRWDPEAGTIDADRLQGTEAVVHLAGEPIDGGRWTPRRKARIRESRVNGTALLCKTMARLDPPPRCLASASAFGYYGDRGDEVLKEDSGPGSDFLAQVTGQWEAATDAAAVGGIRVVNLRFGLVLDRDGGMLRRILLPFKMGLGGTLGSGQQYVSWISLVDAVRAIDHALVTEELVGPVNIAAPRVVTNAQFTRTLGMVLSRPTLFKVPSFALWALLGEGADAVVASARMDSAKLLDSGFVFEHPDLEQALRATMAK